MSNTFSHVTLSPRCIYMIDPASVMTESARRAASSFPTKVRSEVTVSYKPPDLSSLSDETDSEDEEDDDDEDEEDEVEWR